jgi:hypothetical protein
MISIQPGCHFRLGYAHPALLVTSRYSPALSMSTLSQTVTTKTPVFRAFLDTMPCCITYQNQSKTYFLQLC